MARERTPSKITRPLFRRYLHRDRLLKRLDRIDAPVIWISAPAGSGKTTLVSSYLDTTKSKSLWYQVDEDDADIATFFYYMGLAGRKVSPGRKAPLPMLTPEYMMGVPTFTRRFFEDLYGRLKPPAIMVLDNYHEVTAESPFHEVVKGGLAALTEGISVIVVSRSDPPPPFARLLASSDMELLGWDDLRLDRDESRGIVELQGVDDPSEEFIDTLHDRAGGWAAGLVLLAKGAEKDLTGVPPDASRPEAIFDYFADELFAGIEEGIARFLTDTAHLPKMTPAMAEQISGNSDAERLLAGLVRRNFFVERISSPEITYRYHPLFREHLLTEGKKRYGPAGQKAKQKEAASLLEAGGHIEDAADLFIRARDWSSLSRLVVGQAPAMIAQGRSHTVGDWLRAVPEEQLKADPLLLYWLGICTMPLNPAGARGILERSFSLFTGRGDRDGSLRSWSAAVETFLYEWNDFTPLDEWITWFDKNKGFARRHADPHLEAQVTFSVVTALMVRQPDHPDLPRWADRALAVARRSRDENFRVRVYSILVNYYVWRGETASSRMLMREIRQVAQRPGAGPLTSLTWQLMEAGARLWTLADPEGALRQVNESLACAARTGVHVWDHLFLAIGVNCSVMLGSGAQADGFLDRLDASLSPSRRHGYSHYYYLLAWNHFLRGNDRQAREHGEQALAIAWETGYLFPRILCELEMAHIRFRAGDRKEAEGHLSRARTLSRKTGSSVFLFASLLTKAFFALKMGQRASGLKALREALRIGREHAYLTPLWWWDASFFSLLCTRALEEGIEGEYVRLLIRRHGLIPEGTGEAIESWPWPVRVFTMGGFRVVRADETLILSGKGQKKPLEMLKALVALGGKEVPEQSLTDLLWPDADGDLAHRSFETTLYRLRKFLGVDGALTLYSGALSINPAYCFLDLWALESLLSTLERRLFHGGRGTGGEKRLRFPDRLFSLFRGGFLGDDHPRWARARRESLHMRFLAVLEKYGAELERLKQWNDAVRVYRRGLETDALAEIFYQGLMTCYSRLGRRAEAVAVYRRCVARLREGLGTGPSPDTVALYESLIP